MLPRPITATVDRFGFGAIGLTAPPSRIFPAGSIGSSCAVQEVEQDPGRLIGKLIDKKMAAGEVRLLQT